MLMPRPTAKAKEARLTRVRKPAAGPSAAATAAVAALERAARDAAAAARLEALEADSYYDDGVGLRDDSTELVSLVHTSRPKRTAATRARRESPRHSAAPTRPQLVGKGPKQRGAAHGVRPPPRRRLAAVVAAETAALAALGDPAAVAAAPVTMYVAAAAAPPTHLAVMGCTVCGAASRYACASRCGARYCSIACGAAHREAAPRCARPS